MVSHYYYYVIGRSKRDSLTDMFYGIGRARHFVIITKSSHINI